ncbi:MAG: hypothetical protein IT342_10385 [Candidatus Melainabacteria bacterium]|nr:hypothetical protein [Candidatus Melainabacteria bacterium]
MKHYRQLAIAVLLAGLCWQTSILPAAAAKKTGWILRQNSQTYGIVKCILSADGIRMEMGNVKVSIVPPDWRFTFWNDQTKFYFDESLEDFQERVPKKPLKAGWIKSLEPRKPYVEAIAGMKVKNWRWYSYNPKHPEENRLYYDFACSESMGLPRRLMEVACICCYVPPGKGMPLRVMGELQSRPKVLLNTTFITKTMVDPAIFKLPNGYTRVRNEMEVLLKKKGTVMDEDVSDLYRPFPKQ